LIDEAKKLKSNVSCQMPFVLSVQFHPKRLTERYAEHRAIFLSFVQACVRKFKT